MTAGWWSREDASPFLQRTLSMTNAYKGIAGKAQGIVLQLA